MDIRDIHIQIKDLYFNNTWHWNILHTELSEVIKNYINNMQLFLNANVSNGFIWQDNMTGMYTVKSGFNWLVSHTRPSTAPSQYWNWI